MSALRHKPVRIAIRVRDAQGAEQSGYCQTERERSPQLPGPQGNAQVPLKPEIGIERILHWTVASKR